MDPHFERKRQLAIWTPFLLGLAMLSLLLAPWEQPSIERSSRPQEDSAKQIEFLPEGVTEEKIAISSPAHKDPHLKDPQSKVALQKALQKKARVKKPVARSNALQQIPSANEFEGLPDRETTALSDSNDTLEDALGVEAVRAIEELVAEREGWRKPDQVPLSQLLDISESQAQKIIKKENTLREQLKRAEANRATGFKKILVSDHNAWLRFYLGDRKYEKYREISPQF